MSTPAAGVQLYTDDEVRSALQRLLSSRQFSNALHCSALLAYLIQRLLGHDGSCYPSEHEIGVAVFGRDRLTWCGSDAPNVRVQAGRLRLRLAAYYAEEGSADRLRISIPVGAYRPQVQPQLSLARVTARPPPAGMNLSFIFRPITCRSLEPLVAGYAMGLNDELGFRLCRHLPAFRRMNPDMPLPAPGSYGYLLEGSVRHDATRVRVALLLRRGSDGAVLWSAQFDDADDVSIIAQQQMAGRCAQALLQYLPA